MTVEEFLENAEEDSSGQRGVSEKYVKRGIGAHRRSTSGRYHKSCKLNQIEQQSHIEIAMQCKRTEKCILTKRIAKMMKKQLTVNVLIAIIQI